jgi:hypothetical protein
MPGYFNSTCCNSSSKKSSEIYNSLVGQPQEFPVCQALCGQEVW